MRELKYVIKDELGIHARPAGLLVKLLSGFACDVQIGTEDDKVDGKRIFRVMGLAMKQGDEMVLSFDGSDEDEAAAQTEVFLSENL